EKELSAEQQSQANALLQRRLQGEPMAYILGEQEFYGYPFYVSPATLIPRPDTELLVERALVLAPTHTQQVLDLGTGSGAIAMSLSKERSHWHITAVDNSADAVVVAEQNKQRLGADNCSLLLSQWFSQITQRFHLIVSNPPYIDPHDEHLAQ